MPCFSPQDVSSIKHLLLIGCDGLGEPSPLSNASHTFFFEVFMTFRTFFSILDEPNPIARCAKNPGGQISSTPGRHPEEGCVQVWRTHGRSALGVHVFSLCISRAFPPFFDCHAELGFAVVWTMNQFHRLPQFCPAWWPKGPPPFVPATSCPPSPSPTGPPC